MLLLPFSSRELGDVQRGNGHDALEYEHVLSSQLRYGCAPSGSCSVIVGYGVAGLQRKMLEKLSEARPKDIWEACEQFILREIVQERRR